MITPKRLRIMLFILLLINSASVKSQSKANDLRSAAQNAHRLVTPNETAHRQAVSLNGSGSATLLMQSYFDYLSNSSMPRTIYNYGNGKVAVAVMAARSPDADARGSYWSFYDGTSWASMKKIEAGYRGWTSTDALSDGRQIVVSHRGNEVSIDAAMGAGSFGHLYTGLLEETIHIWPRLAVDGADNLHVLSCYRNDNVFGIEKYYVLSTSRDQGLTWTHQHPFGSPPDTSDGKWSSGWADAYAIDAWENKVGIAALSVSRNDWAFCDIYFAESNDYGATFNVTNLTKNETRIPLGSEFRPLGDLTLVYDDRGDAHVAWSNYKVIPDNSIQGATALHSFDAPLRHWSAATGITDILNYHDIPKANEDKNFNPDPSQLDAPLVTTLMHPQLGCDSDKNLYLIFLTFRPNDIDDGGVRYPDIYAVASDDDGKTWTHPINVTDSPGTCDSYASLAKAVDESLHILYYSDDTNSNQITGTQTTPSNLTYYTYPASKVFSRCPNNPDALSLPSFNAYGKIHRGDRTHIEDVRYCFGGRPGDLNLVYEVYDIDSDNEVKITLNDIEITDVLPTPENNQWSERRIIVLRDELINDEEHNDLIFNSVSNPPGGKWWGVRNVVVDEAIPLPFSSAVGRIKNGEQLYIDEACFFFEGTPGHINLLYRTYDIDDGDEVDIYLNDVKIRDEKPTTNLGWSSTRALLLNDAHIHDHERNEIRFVNTVNSTKGKAWFWGVREARLSESIPIPYTNGVGRIPNGDSTHTDEACFSFAGAVGDVVLSYEMFDVDHPKEIDILLNGIKIHDVKEGINNNWTEPRTIVLPDDLVNDDAINQVVFDATWNPPQRYWWGVRHVKINYTTTSHLQVNGNVSEVDNYIFYDLTAEQEIDYLLLSPLDSWHHLFSYRIEGSLDKQSWTALVDQNDRFMQGAHLIQLPPEPLRYLRISGKSFICDLDSLQNLRMSEQERWRMLDDFIKESQANRLTLSSVIPFQQQSFTAVSELDHSLPSNYRLSQNYPNPFNPTTTIQFALPKADYVELNIFNVHGQLIRALMKSELPAGRHKITFNAEELASGVYFTRLEAGEFVVTRKMILSK